ncbi:hypothetical protein CYLTODRAFT_427675 [Cylindrobasidium torrendii FP15055 ss-10]|uniref:Uncharacterized protein n=1 Tax=Cylindrobasidium torrendii FP15055 ss-10 TaxID=1314674 RepID=A0A0D7AV12_9AGAR|nr:hypothetical protein CYLTODRAFT_427675 [Cylindrobasidium torrendii FP15055 ss-10]
MFCNAYNGSRPRTWRQQMVDYDFYLPVNITGGPAVLLPANVDPLPPPGPLVQLKPRWESPFISSSPFPTPFGTPSRLPSHQTAFVRTPGRTPALPPQGLACRLFDSPQPAQTSPSQPPRYSSPRSGTFTPSRLGKILADVTPRLSAPSSPSTSKAVAALPEIGPLEDTVLTSLPDALSRLIVAFYPDDVNTVVATFVRAQRCKNANEACTFVKIPTCMTLPQFMYGLAFIFKFGDPIDVYGDVRSRERTPAVVKGSGGSGSGDDASPFVDK